MNKIYIFALLLAVASANLAVDIGRISTSQDSFNCFAKLKFTRAIAIIADEQGTLYKNFRDNYNSAKAAGFALFDARLLVNDTLIPEKFSATITQALPPSFNGTVWLSVFDIANYWKKPVSQRIAYLESLILAFKQHGVKVGIFSDYYWWKNVFGSRNAGSDILKAVPLCYSFDDVPLPSFNDWNKASFGTWDAPSMKNYEFSIDICSIRANFFNYYETDN